jgi:type III secretion protein L
MVGVYRLKGMGYRVASGAHVVPAAAFEALETADRIVAAAEAEAARILGEAQAAHDAEMRRGHAEGLRQAQMEAIARLVGETAELDRGLAAAEGELTRLVVAAVKKIIAEFDEVARAEAVVKASLAHMRREKRAELLVPPALVEPLRARMAAILAEFPDVELVEVTADATLADDRVVLVSPIGRVDADLAGRIDALETVLRTAHARLAADTLDALVSGGGADAR